MTNDCFFEYKNEFLQEVELFLEKRNSSQLDIKSLISSMQKTVSLLYTDNLDINYDDNSCKFSIRTVVSSDNNVILNKIFTFLFKNQDLLEENKENLADLNLSIYIWAASATDTPQIDLSKDMLKILATIGANFSYVVYTYNPD